jgi:hypothetical protein
MTGRGGSFRLRSDKLESVQELALLDAVGTCASPMIVLAIRPRHQRINKHIEAKLSFAYQNLANLEVVTHIAYPYSA